MYELEPVARDICKIKNYTFVEGKGKGTFKETFHVKNVHNVDEALKVFKDGRCPEDRMKREIDAMLRCAHRNVVRLTEVSKHKVAKTEYSYIIEEYLSGGTLTERLSARLMTDREAQNIGAILIDAISHIASHELVHRDIKPDNILFRDAVTPVIVDFGVVRDLSEYSLTPTWAMSGPGTPFFAAPEQLNNEKDLIDWRTDQFALGVILSLCISGSHPYMHIHDSPEDTTNRVARRDLQQGDILKMLVNKGFYPILTMIAPWPAERYRTPTLLENAWATIKPGTK